MAVTAQLSSSHPGHLNALNLTSVVPASASEHAINDAIQFGQEDAQDALKELGCLQQN